jgi:hypothetical protein
MKNLFKPLSALGIALACSWQMATAQDTPVKTQNHVKIVVVGKDGKKHTIDEKFEGKMPKELKERIKVLQQKTGNNFVLHTDKNIKFDHHSLDKLPARTKELIKKLKEQGKEGKKGFVHVQVIDENGKIKVTEKKLSEDDYTSIKRGTLAPKKEVLQEVIVKIGGDDKDNKQKQEQHFVIDIDENDKTKNKVKSKHFVIRLDGDNKDNKWVHKEGDQVVKLHFDEKHFSGKRFVLKDGKTVKIMIHKVVELVEEDKKANQGEETKARKTEKFDALSELNFYPNPNGGKFNLKFKLADQGNTKIAIYDLKGNVVYNEELPNFTGAYDKAIDLSQQNRGVYIVRISQNGHTMTRKLKIQ